MLVDRSVAVGPARWRAAFLAVFGIEQLIKLVLALRVQPFGDEAFYWQESRHPAWGYSDLPPMTAWLIRLGEGVAGHGLLGMRWPFLLLGASLPWLAWWLARRLFGERAGWQAGLLVMILPLAGSLGVLALPDVPLTVATLLALCALSAAMQEDHRGFGAWMLLGLALACAWMTHYRAAMPMLAGLLLFVASPGGRRQWRRPGFWLAMAVAALGLLPLLISNLHQHGAGIAFQLVERNPWRFHADALVQPLEQALVCTPLLYALMLWAGWRCLRRWREGGPWPLFAVTAWTFLLGYLLFGLFADDTRFRVHWPLPGYLPLLVVLPALLAPMRMTRGRRVALASTLLLAVLAQLSVFAYLGATAVPRAVDMLAGLKAFPDNFTGWRRSADAVRQQLDTMPHDTVLVADNFMLAAELDFQLDGRRPVFVLDSPLNTKHGRAPQLALWQLDEAGLRRTHAGEAALLMVDETALRVRQTPAWLGSICARMADPQPLQRLDLYGGQRRFALYGAQVPTRDLPHRDRDRCVVWRRAYAARP